MAASRKVVELRNVLAERFGSTSSTQTAGELATGLEIFDRAGGLAKGSITEITSPQPSAGSALLIHCLLRVAQEQRFFFALVDGRDSFDLGTVSETALAHLLWVRCETATEAIKAADLLLRDGNFPLVILDLVLNPAAELRRIPATSWYRLQRLVEGSPIAFLVMSRHNLVPSARTKLLLENRSQLADLQNDDALARVRLRVRRSNSALCHSERRRAISSYSSGDKMIRDVSTSST